MKPYLRNTAGLTLIELLIVIAIIGILSAIAVPNFIGQTRNAARTEAMSNLENLRLLEEQFYAENGSYAPNRGTCAKNNSAANVTAIQLSLPRFRPSSDASYSYCIELDKKLDGIATSNCFRARAFGNTSTRVTDDVVGIDCFNARSNF